MASAGWNHLKRPDRRTLAFSAVYGILLAGAVTLGRAIYTGGHLADAFTPWEHLLSSLLVFMGFSALFTCVCALILPLLKCRSTTGKKTPHRFFFPLCHGIIFLAWLPALLAFWPGIHSYDVWLQTPQALGPLSGYSRFHSPLHTLFWALCLRAGRHLGIHPLTLYALLQMLAVSSVYALTVTFLRRSQVHRLLVYGALVYFALNPALAVFSIIMTKDVLFGAFLFLLVIQCVLLVRNPDHFLRQPRRMACFALCAVVTLLLRNNAVYMLLLAFPFFLIGLRRYAGRVAGLFALCLLPYLLINGPVYDAMGIQPGKEEEILSVPLSQMANVVLQERDTLDEETLQALDQYIPVDQIDDIYNPRLADPLKLAFQVERYQQDRGAFFQLWFSLLQKYPACYIEAFLNLNLPYWYPGAATVDPLSAREYIEIYNWPTDAFSTERKSLLPGLLPFYERVADFSLFQHLPVVNILFSITTPVWLLLFCLLTLGWKRQWRLALPLLLPFFLWLTYLAGPVSNFRYVEPLIAMYPLWIAMAFRPECFSNP